MCVAVPISFCWTTTRREAYCEAIPIKTLRSSGLLQLRKRKCHTSPSLRMTLFLCGTLRPTRIACYLTVFRPVTPSAWLSFSSGKNRTRPFAASRADHLDTVPYDFPSGYPCPEHRLLCGGALKKESFRFPAWIVAQHKQSRPCCVNLSMQYHAVKRL